MKEKVEEKPIVQKPNVKEKQLEPIIIQKAPTAVIIIEKKTEFKFEEKPIETNAVIETEDYKVFQTMSQEEFNKEATFINTSKPNPDNPKQFNRWHELQKRKDCHEGPEEIEAKEIEENRDTTRNNESN
jgi:hypothetical protein